MEGWFRTARRGGWINDRHVITLYTAQVSVLAELLQGADVLLRTLATPEQAVVYAEALALGGQTMADDYVREIDASVDD
jgi:hypothetical protein